MTVLAIVDTILLVLALVYIVALLRSHADILRRLAIVEDARDAPAATGPGSVPPLTTALDVAGTSLDGEPQRLALGAGSEPTLLAFLTSGCSSCAPLWRELADPAQLTALGVAVVVVAHGSTRESPARLRELAPSGVPVIVSDAAWEAYGVPSSPHFVLTDGGGGVAGRGSALSWAQLSGLVSDARADSGAPARTTEQRAARAERALAEAGIGAGHPSLYPAPGAAAEAE